MSTTITVLVNLLPLSKQTFYGRSDATNHMLPILITISFIIFVLLLYIYV